MLIGRSLAGRFVELERRVWTCIEGPPWLRSGSLSPALMVATRLRSCDRKSGFVSLNLGALSREFSAFAASETTGPRRESNAVEDKRMLDAPIVRRLPIAALLAVLLAAGCRTTLPADRQMEDATIMARVRAELVRELQTRTLVNINIDVTEGVVTLAGPVATEEDERRAEQIVREVDGVVRVNNNLIVVGREPDENEAPETTPAEPQS